MIIVDTSCWVEYFRGKDPVYSQVAELIHGDSAVLIGPVITEILRGVVRNSTRTQIEQLLQGLTYLKQPEKLWTIAGMLGATVAKKGYGVKTLDLLIAAYALDADLPLYSMDKDFRLMQKAGVPLRLA